jgi:hypothetical protein
MRPEEIYVCAIGLLFVAWGVIIWRKKDPL